MQRLRSPKHRRSLCDNDLLSDSTLVDGNLLNNIIMGRTPIDGKRKSSVTVPRRPTATRAGYRLGNPSHIDLARIVVDGDRLQ